MNTKALSSLLFLVGLFCVASCASLTTTIPPDAMTVTAMGETKVRYGMYLSQQGEYPKSLADLPKRDGYINRITDGWGRPLIYEVDDSGIVTLRSLGADGLAGGSGDDADIERKFTTRNAAGEINVDDELWLVDSYVDDSDPR